METPTYQKPTMIRFFSLHKDTDAETRKKVFDLLVKHNVPIDYDTMILGGVQDPEYPYLDWDAGTITEAKWPDGQVFEATEFLAQFGIDFTSSN